MVGSDGVAAILEPQHVLEQDLQAEGQLRHIAELFRRLGERVVRVFLAPDFEGGTGAESILADLGHASTFLLLWRARMRVRRRENARRAMRAIS